MDGWIFYVSKDTIFKIEIRIVFEHRVLGWDKGYRQLEVDCDNALLMKTILAEKGKDSNMVELHLIYNLLNYNWKIFFRHISRLQNKITEHIIKFMATNFTGIK